MITKLRTRAQKRYSKNYISTIGVCEPEGFWGRKIAMPGALECGGSTPPWHSIEEEDKGGVEPPHSKVLRTWTWTMTSRKYFRISCRRLL